MEHILQHSRVACVITCLLDFTLFTFQCFQQVIYVYICVFDCIVLCCCHYGVIKHDDDDDISEDRNFSLSYCAICMQTNVCPFFFVIIIIIMKRRRPCLLSGDVACGDFMSIKTWPVHVRANSRDTRHVRRRLPVPGNVRVYRGPRRRVLMA